MNDPTIFISYSHKDEEWKDRLVTHLRVLKGGDVIDPWDDRRIGAGDDWYEEIEKAIKAASVAVLMVSAYFLTSNYIIKEEIPRLLKRSKKEGLRIFPVIVKPCAWQQVKWLARIQTCPKDGRPLSGGSDYQIDTDLTAIAEEIVDIIKHGGHVPSSLGPNKIYTAKLPSTSPDLFGREKELKALDEAWENPKVNVLSLVAWGGVGKTALVNKWLLQLAQNNYRGAERIFGWSFYSQGAVEGRQVSADPFIATALTWFGDLDPTLGSPWDKGERLAELVRKQRTLFILDGLEPLQNPPPVESGKIKDPGLRSLLRELARQNPGLLIITTRLLVDDLKDFTGSSATVIDLENLSPVAGATYLAHLGVLGTEEELKRASVDFGGHALALTLLGSYLKVVHQGDVRQRDKIARLTDEKKQGAHARRVMESYERWFEGKPELDILRLMGLFDRPAGAGALNALRKKPAIVDLTTRLQGFTHEDWQYAVENLRVALLLSASDKEDPDTLDCHPLLREYFSDRISTTIPQAWREANSRLYEYYQFSAKEFPDTIEGMALLYAAVAHGCQAGRHQEVLDEVYVRRIQRGKEAFNKKKLGAFGADLATLSGFFDPPWRQPVEGLVEDHKAFVLNEAGFDLRALGRLAEAAQPMLAGLDAHIAQKDWVNAARATGNLSELYLTMGDIKQAIGYAKQSVDLADLSGDAYERVSKRATVADALHQAGHMVEAEAVFREAERMQKARGLLSLPVLYSLQGFQYCDFLLSQGKYQEVLRRVVILFEWRLPGDNPLDIALEHLSRGSAHLLELHIKDKRDHSTLLKADYSQITIDLEKAVEGLRQAGHQDYLSRGLLARAELRRVSRKLNKARHDLDEALSITTRGVMRLHEADCRLEYARFYLAGGNKKKAREYFEQAKKMIEEMGYHRSDKEVRKLEKQL